MRTGTRLVAVVTALAASIGLSACAPRGAQNGTARDAVDEFALNLSTDGYSMYEFSHGVDQQNVRGYDGAMVFTPNDPPLFEVVDVKPTDDPTLATATISYEPSEGAAPITQQLEVRDSNPDNMMGGTSWYVVWPDSWRIEYSGSKDGSLTVDVRRPGARSSVYPRIEPSKTGEISGRAIPGTYEFTAVDSGHLYVDIPPVELTVGTEPARYSTDRAISSAVRDAKIAEIEAAFGKEMRTCADNRMSPWVCRITVPNLPRELSPLPGTDPWKTTPKVRDLAFLTTNDPETGVRSSAWYVTMASNAFVMTDDATGQPVELPFEFTAEVSTTNDGIYFRRPVKLV